MSRSIIYIINPISGVTVKKKLQQLIEEKTSQQNIPYQIFFSNALGDYTFLHPIIQNEKITDVVIAGGDGTISQVVHSLKHFNINFGIIPCGSGNGLALAAKIPTNSQKALEVIFKNKSSWVDGMTINNYFSCMLCGVGFDAQVAKEFASTKKRGLESYIKICLNKFWHIRSYPFEAEYGDKKNSTQAFFISVANSNQFGNHFTIAPKASLSDGLLDLVIVKKQNKIVLIFQLLRQLFGWNRLSSVETGPHHKTIEYLQTEKLILHNLHLAPLHIDGEPVPTAERLTIEIIKKCFKLLQP